MGEPPRELFERYVELLNSQDWTHLDDFLHPDYVEEYPHSGERIRGTGNLKAMMENYPSVQEMTGNIGNVHVAGGDERWEVTPAFTVVRVDGTDDVFTGIARSRYPDGSTWYIIAAVRLRSGKFWRSTTYFAQEFPAPEWRSRWVERYSPE
jgi:hypothetical protein